MNTTWLVKSPSNNSLILLFAGWGMDWHPFVDYKFPNRDFAVVWDYNSYENILESLNNYREICVFAWSFGVAVASRFLADNTHLPITLRVAVNGTPWPVDDQRGISRNVFFATKNAFSETSLEKFRRRMCGSKDALIRFNEKVPQRTIGSLASELERMEVFESSDEYARLWDKVYIGMADMIIPSENQLKAWSGHPNIVRLEATPHLPDIRRIISNDAIDKCSVAESFRKSAETYETNAIVQRKIAKHLSELIPEKNYDTALEVGCGTGLLTEELNIKFSIGSLLLWDLTAIMPNVEICDAETAIRMLPDSSLDLIASASAIQWFHAPFAFIKECLRVLRPGGVLAISTFAPGTYREIELSADVSIPYIPVNNWREFLVGENCESRLIEENEISLAFSTPLDVLRHMKLTGVNSLGKDRHNTFSIANRILHNYPQSDDGNDCCKLTYKPVFILLIK